MSRKIQLGHIEAHEKLTARLFWKLKTDRGYVDAGNVRDYSDASSRNLVTRTKSARGARHVDAEVVDVNHEAWTFLLDEQVPDQQRLLRLAKAETDVTQQQAEGQTASIESVELGRWFEIGSYNVANLRVTSSLHGLLEEGEDYEVNRKAGRIKVLEDGGVGAGEDLVLTFDRPELTFERSTSKQRPVFFCDFILEEYNQFSGLFLRRHRFEGYLNVSEFPQQTGDFAAYRARVTARGEVVTDKRSTAETVAEYDETPAPAGDSSSSQSLSSSSSRSSRSSLSSSSMLSYTSSYSSSSTAQSGASSNSSSSSANSSSSSSKTSSSSEGDQTGAPGPGSDAEGGTGSL